MPMTEVLGNSEQPCCLIIGGAEGAGKSTLLSYMDTPGIGIPVIVEEADKMPPRPGDTLGLGSQLAARLDTLLARATSFAFETNFSEPHSLQLMKSAREASFRLVLHYVLLRHPRLNMLRVRTRKALGGKDTSNADIVRSYKKSLERLPQAIRLSDTVFIYDNSGRHPELKAHLDRGLLKHVVLDPRLTAHQRIADALQRVEAGRS